MNGNRTYHHQETRARQISPGLLDQFRNTKPWKRLLSAILEQRYMIKFLVKEQNILKEIRRKLKVIFDDEGMKQTQVYW
jgi:hypothetical protein